jgi:hypothetical protein
VRDNPPLTVDRKVKRAAAAHRNTHTPLSHLIDTLAEPLLANAV